MKNRVFIETKRNGYSPEQCGRTMTVADLIETLSYLEEDAEVFFRHDNGYTYGSISDEDIYGQTEED